MHLFERLRQIILDSKLCSQRCGQREMKHCLAMSDCKHSCATDVHFARKFKHLGSRISNMLSDESKILMHTRQATNQVAALGNFFALSADLWSSQETDPTSHACEHSCLRCERHGWSRQRWKRNCWPFCKEMHKIMRINMHQVRDCCIRSEHLRNKMDSPDMMDTIRLQQFKFIGKMARQDDAWLPRRLIGAWAPKVRKLGRPQHTIRRACVETLRSVLGEQVVSLNAPFAEWMPLAQQKKEWDKLGQHWLHKQRLTAKTMHGNHPLLGTPCW